jgi:PKD repeat protein
VSVSHTYTITGTLTVVLRVTDDDGDTDTARKTLVITPSAEPGTGGEGPTASFTATPLTGPSPLVVTFNASASAYAGHAITYYSWDFGDGTTGTGITTTHVYAPGTTTTYHVVLRIIASDNTEGLAEKDIMVTVVTPTPPTGGPTADFDVDPGSEQICPFTFEFDPEDSRAQAGRELTTFVWNFGDQSSQTENTDTPVEHTYYTSQASQEFTVTLTVIDDHGATDAYARTVRVKNMQPVAGFEMDGGDGWDIEDIEFFEVETDPQNVEFRSLAPEGDEWDQDRGTVDTDLPNESTSKKPANFETGTYGSGDRNLAYDREGNGSNDGFTWGLISYIWDFGDGSAKVTVEAELEGSCDTVDHDFQLGADEEQKAFTVTLEVVDSQGARASFSRIVRLYKREE